MDINEYGENPKKVALTALEIGDLTTAARAMRCHIKRDIIFRQEALERLDYALQHELDMDKPSAVPC